MTTLSEIHTRTTTNKTVSGQGKNRVLWILQVLLALLFLFAGTMKLVLPIAALTKQVALPGLFLRFLGVAEVLGAIGLIVPWLSGIRRELTAIAALGLTTIMTGATTIILITGGGASAIFPFVIGILLLIVAHGRKSSCDWFFAKSFANAVARAKAGDPCF